MKNSMYSFLLVMLMFTLFSCKKDDNIDIDDDNPNIGLEVLMPSSEYYFSGTIDDEEVLIESYNGTLSTSGGCSDIGQDALDGGVWSDIDTSTFENKDRVYALIYIPNNASANLLQNRFNAYAEGEKGIFDCNSEILKGGEITYFDEEGNEWTSNGPQNSTAYFNILERKGIWTADASSAPSTFDIKATFRCTLYNSEGDSKEIINGAFNSLFPFAF